MKKPSPAVSQILARSSHLGKLLQTGRRQEKILNTIKQLLPSTTACHCISSHYDGQTLKLFFDSPVWASRVRFEANRLKASLAERHIPIQRVNISVLPPTRLAPPELPRHGPEPLSADAARCLLQAAEGVSDPALDRALKRLASHVQAKKS